LVRFQETGKLARNGPRPRPGLARNGHRRLQRSAGLTAQRTCRMPQLGIDKSATLVDIDIWFHTRVSGLIPASAPGAAAAKATLVPAGRRCNPGSGGAAIPQGRLGFWRISRGAGFSSVWRAVEAKAGWLPPARDDNLPVVPDPPCLRRPIAREQRPESTAPRRGSPAVEPQLPAHRLFQGQVQVVRQLFEAHLAQPDPLAVQHRIRAEEHEAQHQN